MFLKLDDAGAVRNDHGNAVVVHFFFDDPHVLVMVLWQRHYVADMLRFHAEAFADAADLVVCRRRLAACHSRDVVVENHHHDIGFLVHAVHETSQAAVAEGAVANDRHAWEDTHFASALGHGDGCSHTHGGVDGTHVEAQGVASDVAEHLATFMFCHNLVQGGVAVNVRAALAERWRTVGYDFRHC